MDSLRDIERISTEKAKELIGSKMPEEDFVLLDVREPREYQAGHIAGARHIPLSSLKDRAAELPGDRQLLVYCRRGHRSLGAASLLVSLGFERVASLEGGIEAWQGNVLAHGDPQRIGTHLLEGRKTLEELISLAWALEEATRNFYETMRQRTASAEEDRLLRWLASAEEEHKKIVVEAYRKIKGPDAKVEFLLDESMTRTLEGGFGMSETLNWIRRTERTIFELFELFMLMEANALDLYITMLKQIEAEEARLPLLAIIEEENKHLETLGRMLEARQTAEPDEL